MNKRQEARAKFQKNARSKFLRNWLASLFTTVSVVVVVIVILPRSAEATIRYVEPFKHEIAYSVLVTDEDSSIIDGTLKVVLTNQMDHREYDLALGQSSGIFENLQPNTIYQLLIQADKGFGSEVLASQSVTTLDVLNGAIVSVVGSEGQNPYYLNYDIRTFYSDPNLELQSVQLRYGYRYPYEPEITTYQTQVITQFDQSFTILDIPNYNCEIELIFEGLTTSGDTMILEETRFYTPFILNASMYLTQITDTSVKVNVYPDVESATDISYKVVLRDSRRVVDEKTVQTVEGTMHQDIPEVEFTGLFKNTDYTVELVVTYRDPSTLTYVTETLYTESLTTLGNFWATAEVVEYDTYYDVTITVEDPNHYFQKGVFWYYEVTPEFDFLLQSMYYDFTPSGNTKSTHFTINKTGYESFRIEIGISSETNYTIYVILDEITNAN